MPRRLIVFAFILAICATSVADEAKKDLDALQGEWVMVGLEVEGKPVPEEKIQGTTLTIKGDKYIVSVKDKKHEITITLDPTTSPKHIDMAFPNGTDAPNIGKGIYKIEGDKLIVCRVQSTDGARPTQFGTFDNTGLFQVTWQRKGK